MEKICPHYKSALIQHYGDDGDANKIAIAQCDGVNCGAYPCSHVAKKQMSAEQAVEMIRDFILNGGHKKDTFIGLAEKLGFEREGGEK